MELKNKIKIIHSRVNKIQKARKKREDNFKKLKKDCFALREYENYLKELISFHKEKVGSINTSSLKRLGDISNN